MVVRIFDNLAGDADVLLKGFAALVNHDGGKAAVDAAFAQLKAVAMVQMEADGETGLDDGGLDQLHQIGVIGIGTGTLADLQDQRSIEVLGSLCDALHDLHIVDIERADGIAAVIGLFEHFFRCYQWHNHFSLSISLSCLERLE